MESPGASLDGGGLAPPSSVSRGSALLLLAQISSNLGFFVAILIIARVLEPSGRGTVAFVTVAAAILARLALAGVDNATIVLAAQRPNDRPTLLANLYGFAVVAASGVGLVVGAVVLVSGRDPVGVGHGELAVLVGGCVAVAVTDAGLAFLLGIGRPGDWTKVAALAPWIYAATLGGLALAGALTVFLAVLAWALAHVGWALVVWMLCVRRSGLGRPRLDLLLVALRLGIRVWVGSLSRFLNFRLDQILLGLLTTDAVLGIYAIAVNLSEVTLYVPGAVAATSIAAIARASDTVRAEQTLRTFRLLFVVTAAGCLAAVLAAPLIPLIFGPAYDDSVVPYLLLLPGAMGFAASGVFSSALLSSSRPALSSIGPLVALVSGVVLDLALIPPFGASGAAAAATSAFVAGGLVAIVAYRRTEPFGLRELVPRRADLAVIQSQVRTWVARIVRRRSAPPAR